MKILSLTAEVGWARVSPTRKRPAVQKASISSLYFKSASFEERFSFTPSCSLSQLSSCIYTSDFWAVCPQAAVNGSASLADEDEDVEGRPCEDLNGRRATQPEIARIYNGLEWQVSSSFQRNKTSAPRLRQ